MPRLVDVGEAQLTRQVKEAVHDVLPKERRHGVPAHHDPHGSASGLIAFAPEVCPEMQIVDVLQQAEVGSVPQQRAEELCLEGSLDVPSAFSFCFGVGALGVALVLACAALLSL